MSTHSQKFLRKRKFLVALPLLIFPFVTMAFYVLGGGKNSGGITRNQKTLEGLNLDLPTARLKDDKNVDKLSFYEKAEADEKRKEDATKNDPYFKLGDTDSTEIDTVSNELEMIVDKAAKKYKPVIGNNGIVQSVDGSNDPHAKAIYDKLRRLESEINTVPAKPRGTNSFQKTNAEEDDFSGNVDRLQDMMEQLNGKREGDPEMQKLDGMLNKILDIQHPERVKEQISAKAIVNKQNIMQVTKINDAVPISLFGNDGVTDTFPSKRRVSVSPDFYSTEDLSGDIAPDMNAIRAVVHETQTLVNGSIVKMRLLEDVVLGGKTIPKDNFVYGTVSLSGERLRVEVSSIRCQNSIFPVKLDAYDMDGLDGIHIPGAITLDASKQSANEALSMMEMTNLDPSLAAQATSAGIGAVKNLLSKKVKLIKVVVKAGYSILLKDNNTK